MFPDNPDQWREVEPTPWESTESPPVPATTARPPRPQVQQAGLAGLVLGVFLFGALIGVGADRWISAHPLPGTTTASAASLSTGAGPGGFTTNPNAAPPAAAPGGASNPQGSGRPGRGAGFGNGGNGSGSASGSAGTGRSAAPTATPAPSGTPATPDQQQAIQAVIQKGDQEQAQALTSNDPTVMQDSATSDFYQQQVQTNQELTSHGVTAIKLVNVEWGPITVDGTTATATAFETWSTTYSDGTSEQSRDRNVYTLVQDNGAWKVSADAHPDARQPSGNGFPRQPGSSQPGQPRGPRGLPGGSFNS